MVKARAVRYERAVADLEQAEIVVVGGAGRAEERGTSWDEHADLETEHVLIERDLAVEAGYVQDGVIEASYRHFLCLSQRTTVPSSHCAATRIPRHRCRLRPGHRVRGRRRFIRTRGLDRPASRDAEVGRVPPPQRGARPGRPVA